MKYKLFFSILFMASVALAQPTTWSDHVASIVYDKCSSCHHPGAIGPFSLMSYNDAVTAAAGILDAVTDNRMPPWPPDTSYRKFAHQRALNAQQKTAIVDWINSGMPAGNLNNAPAPPVFPVGSAVNQTPDLVAQMPVFTNYASTTDIYQCFVIPSGLNTSKYIRGFEVIPGNRQMVHHVLIFADTTGSCANLDAQDPNPGYLSFGGVGASSARLIGLWVPGAQPQFYPNGMGLRLPANADIVFQIHYPAGTMGLQDSTKVNFFFSNAPSIRALRVDPILNHSSSLTNGPLYIAANQTKTFYGQYAIPAQFGKVSVLQVAPHMHLIGRSIQSNAVAPNNVNIPLIRINDWNFMWQGGYDFQQVQVIPAGSTLYYEAFYDNTSANPYNPSNPTINVEAGEATNDEMMLVYFTYTAYQQGDENIIIDSTLVTSQNSKSYDEINDLKIYPNPVENNMLTFDSRNMTGNKALVCIKELTGRELYRQELTLGGGLNTIDLPNMNNGIYLLLLIDDSKTIVKKFNYIKQ